MRTDGGWNLPDFLKWNKTRVEVEEGRRERAEAGRKGGLRSGATRSKGTARTEAPAEAIASRFASSDVEPQPRTQPQSNEPASNHEDQINSGDSPDRDGAMSRVTQALSRLARYTNDPDFAAELARDDGVKVIIEQLAAFADRLAQSGETPLTPETQRKRIRSWLSVARAEIDEERQRVRAERRWSGSIEEQMHRDNLRTAREKADALGWDELSDEECELLETATRAAD